MRRWMKRHKILTGLMVIFVAGFLVNHIAVTRYYQGVIPEKIEINGRLFIDMEQDFFMGGCGIAVFALSDKTTQEIKSSGIAFLENARIGKGHRILLDDNYVEYEDWKETPNAAELSDGLPVAFSCASEIDEEWRRDVLMALSRSGSFYTRAQHGGGLIVIPDMKIVVFTFYQ